MKSSVLAFSLFLIFPFFKNEEVVLSTSPIGVWETIDDSSGKARSQIKIYEQDGKLFGKITKLLLRNDNPKCDECSGSKKNKPIVGLVIIEDMPKYDNYWKGGTILDPESGSEYDCSLWFENKNYDKLYVRGRHWTGLYRTQTWNRLK